MHFLKIGLNWQLLRKYCFALNYGCIEISKGVPIILHLKTRKEKLIAILLYQITWSFCQDCFMKAAWSGDISCRLARTGSYCYHNKWERSFGKIEIRWHLCSFKRHISTLSIFIALPWNFVGTCFTRSFY